MNRRVVLFHLREAVEELDRTIDALSRDRRYGEEALEVAMGHAYHHLNTAWNGRNQTDKQFRDCTDQDFKRFRRFPSENEFVYLEAFEREPAPPNRRPERRRPIRMSRNGGSR